MTANTENPKPRHYLPSEQRKKDLLDAALVEFSEHGYVAATMSKIATRAGLSKAGVYAHYKSKDEMFEELLMQLLKPSFPVNTWLLDDGLPLTDAIDAFIKKVYEPLEDPKVMAMVKLLFSEASRAMPLVRRWRDEVIRPYMQEQQKVIDECVAKGLMRDGVMTRYFNLSMAPLVMELHEKLLFGETITTDDARTIRDIHRDLLRELLVMPTPTAS